MKQTECPVTICSRSPCGYCTLVCRGMLLLLHGAAAFLPSNAGIFAGPVFTSRQAFAGVRCIANEMADCSDEVSQSYSCTNEEHAAMAQIGGQLASAYGEITAAGFSSLGKRLKLTAEDSFVDCGSGLGRTVVQAAREFGVRESYGIEYAASRHNCAVASLSEGAQAADAAVVLLQGDCAADNWWAAGGELSACTCAYVNNKLFDDTLNGRIKSRLEGASRLTRVVAFKPWPGGLAGFAEPVEVRCETSWSPVAAPTKVFGYEVAFGGQGSPAFIYERRDANLPTWWTGEIEGALVALTLVVGFSAWNQ